jgi:hypothetical protein
LLYYGESGVTEDQNVLGTPSTPFSTGLVLHPTKVPARRGFFLEASWQPSECDASNITSPSLGADGFAIIFLKDLPTNEQVENSVGTLGIGGVPNAYVFGYSSSYNEFYVCQWNEPLAMTQTPGELRNHCQVFPRPGSPLTCGSWWYFDLVLESDQLELKIDGVTLVFSVPFVMDPVEYYFGMSFGNDNYHRKQELLELLYYYVDTKTHFNLLDANLSEDLNFCGGAASIDNTSIKLINGNQYQYGAASLSSVVYPNNGFVTKFTWTPSNCDDFGIGGEGFSFFFSNKYPTCTGGIGFALGVANLPNIHAFAYSSRFDRFFVCNWTTPLAYFREESEVCQSVRNTFHPRLSCGASYNFVLYYVNSTLNVFVNNYPLMATTMHFENNSYVPGFTAASESMFYFRQDITDWVFSTDLSSVNLTDFIPPSTTFPPVTAPPVVPPVAAPVVPPVEPPVQAPTPVVECPADPPQSPPASSLVFLGNAQLIGRSVRLTDRNAAGGSGLVYRAQPLSVDERYLFMSKFTWTPTNCDPVYDGADGWTFFLTKNAPTLEQVQSSSGGLLGIQNVPNTVMFAYSATFNEFWISNWTLPYEGNLRWVSERLTVAGPKYTCGGSFNFSIVYYEPVIQIRLNNQLLLSTPVVLDPVPYYIGLSGATGGGYFQQDFTNWTITLPVNVKGTDLA